VSNGYYRNVLLGSNTRDEAFVHDTVGSGWENEFGSRPCVFPSSRKWISMYAYVNTSSRPFSRLPSCSKGARCISRVYWTSRFTVRDRRSGRNGTRVSEDVSRHKRVRVIIERAAPHSARFGDPLAVDNAYSLLTYIVVDARSRPRDLFSMHRNIRSTDFARPRNTGKSYAARNNNNGAVRSHLGPRQKSRYYRFPLFAAQRLFVTIERDDWIKRRHYWLKFWKSIPTCNSARARCIRAD